MTTTELLPDAREKPTLPHAQPGPTPRRSMFEHLLCTRSAPEAWRVKAVVHKPAPPTPPCSPAQRWLSVLVITLDTQKLPPCGLQGHYQPPWEPPWSALLPPSPASSVPRVPCVSPDGPWAGQKGALAREGPDPTSLLPQPLARVLQLPLSCCWRNFYMCG